MRSSILRAANAAPWILALALLFPLARSSSAGPSEIRPIEDWLVSQGTYCIDDGAGGCLLFVPPVQNYLGWVSAFANPPVYFASMDYAGLANAWLVSQGHPDLGTALEGSVRERSLSASATEVRVVLHVRNALSWANECCDFATGELLFGARASDVAAGASPALGDGELSLTFVHSVPRGGPLPDLLQLLFSPTPGQILRSLSFTGRATGALHEAFGVAEGTPGRLGITQVGILHSGFHGAVGDAFPAESIELRVVGEGSQALRSTPTPARETIAMVSPNPLRGGDRATIAYRIPDGGARVEVSVYTAAGRRVSHSVRGFEAAGDHAVQWAGVNESGARLGVGLYFVRVSVGGSIQKMSLIVLD